MTLPKCKECGQEFDSEDDCIYCDECIFAEDGDDEFSEEGEK